MTAMKVITLLTSSYFASTLSFSPRNLSPRVTRSINQIKPPLLQVKGSSSESEEPIDATVIERLEELTPEQKEQVGNLVADEEWAGLSMELADVVRTAVVEDLKKNSREFLDKDEYALGDFSKEIDRRVKDEVAKMRNKDEYELGDFSVVLDDQVKKMVCEMTGKESYDFGDLSVEVDSRVKASVATFCGKDQYELGDLSKEVAKRTKVGIMNYLGKESYEFGDLTKALADKAKQRMLNYTGKSDYEFGDVTKKLMGNLFGGKDGKK